MSGSKVSIRFPHFNFLEIVPDEGEQLGVSEQMIVLCLRFLNLPILITEFHLSLLFEFLLPLMVLLVLVLLPIYICLVLDDAWLFLLSLGLEGFLVTVRFVVRPLEFIGLGGVPILEG